MGSHEDITFRKQQEKKIIETKNKLRDVIDNASELIILVDTDCKIELWNNTAEKLTGFPRKQVVGKSVLDLGVFEEPSLIYDSVNKIINRKKVPKKLLTFKGKNGRKRLLQPSYSAVSGKYTKGVLLIGTDVTEESENHGKILPGRGYFLQSENNKEAIPLIRHLIQRNNKGLFISRLKEKQMFYSSGLTNNTYLNLSLSDMKNNAQDETSLINMIEQKVKQFCQNNKSSIIYFDRLDYLLYHYSFNEAIRLLYRIHEHIFKYTCVLIVRVNPRLLNIEQLTALQEEFLPLPSKDVTEIQLEDKLFSILLFVKKRQKNNSIVSFKTIKREFSIVDVTVKKRINTLENLDLIYIKQRGRMKTIHLTEKGHHLISKREMI
jgi:PAS domain S-box-containing protein